PGISFNYLGQLDSPTGTGSDSALWQLSAEHCGVQSHVDNLDDWCLSISGAVVSGQLHFKLDSQLSAEQSETVASTFEQALIEVIDQTINVANTGQAVKTASDYALAQLSTAQLDALKQRYDIEYLFAATSLQQGFIAHYLSQPDDNAYRVQMRFDYHQALVVEQYIVAWGLASLQFPALRTAFDWQNGIIQVVSKGVSIGAAHFSVEDISDLEPAVQAQHIDNIQQNQLATPFDLTQPGLLRLALLKLADDHYSVIKTEHHSIGDGWSSPLLLQAVHQYYEQLVAGVKPKVSIDNGYVAAQHYYRDSKVTVDNFWQNQRQSWLGANDINRMLSRSIDLSQSLPLKQPSSQQLLLGGADFVRLKAMCCELGITVNVVLQFAWHKLLQSYSQDLQTIVGTTVSGRDIPVDGIESSVGLFINTLPCAVNWQAQQTIAQLLQTLQQDIAALNSYSSVSLAQLQNHGERLFHTLFIFENTPPAAQTGVETGIEAVFVNGVEKTHYPLTITAYETSDAVMMRLSGDQSWLSDVQSQRLLTQINALVTQLSDNSQQSPQQLSLFDDSKAASAEKQQLLHHWQQNPQCNQQAKRQDITFAQMFAAQVAKTPDKIAVVFNRQQLTYRQLDTQANALAAMIRAEHYQRHQQALGRDSLIALYLARNLDTIISIIAVQKAGAAYVPIAIDMPKQRVQFILEDTQAALVICQNQQVDQLQRWVSESNNPTAILATDALENHNANGPDLAQYSNDPAALAYVIYTSGTTGQPKGVMIEQGTFASFISTFSHSLNDSSTAGISTLSCTAYAFDIFGLEYGVPLTTGGQLILSDIQSVNADMEHQTIDFIQLTPSMWPLFLQQIDNHQMLSD
ncbi:MAG: condensation domain-containing protein, partial [Psychrosphaera sp.]|nr:condensation domain-containing protein [Psychrosphaera sp.]